MCGRYYRDQEICPAMEAPVLTGRSLQGGKNRGPAEGSPGMERMRWGFPVPEKKSRIINARAETALEKRIFRDNLLHRRCAVPARHYYEWNRERERVTFSLPGAEEFYLAGCYQRYGDEDCFVILTVPANASVESVHDRMPLILKKEEAPDWLLEDSLTGYFLSKGSPLLEKHQEYQQQTLFSQEDF